MPVHAVHGDVIGEMARAFQGIASTHCVPSTVRQRARIRHWRPQQGQGHEVVEA
jgi:hypothetical protein